MLVYPKELDTSYEYMILQRLQWMLYSTAQRAGQIFLGKFIWDPFNSSSLAKLYRNIHFPIW